VNSSLQNVVSKASSVLSGNTNGGGSGTDPEPDPEPVLCQRPTQVDVTVLSGTSASITLPKEQGAIKYRLRYRRVGTSSWRFKNFSTPPYTLTGLATGKTYDIQVRVQCPQGWTSFSSKTRFTTTVTNPNPTGCALNAVTIKLILDEYGSETSWELEKNSNGQIVANGGPYQDGQNGKKVEKVLCIPDGCYTLFIDDAYGDGICCSYGDGSLELIDKNGSVIGQSDGNFGSYDYIDFCVENNIFSYHGNRTDLKIEANDGTKFMIN